MSNTGFILADEGYDVWLGNARGNVYSTKHTTYTPYSIFPTKRKVWNVLNFISNKFFNIFIYFQQYWNFSFHEIGFFDLPACIDYILSKTEESKLQYIAHSQGTTAYFVMMSERPEYNDKVEMMHGIAPVAFLSNLVSPPIHTLLICLPVLKVRIIIAVYILI